MKPLLSTLKENKRYLVYEVITARPLGRDITDDMLTHLSRTLGVFGMADAGVLSVSYNIATQCGVLRVSTTHVSRVRAALVLTPYLGKQRVCIRTRGVSGILQKTQRFLPHTQEE